MYTTETKSSQRRYNFMCYNGGLMLPARMGGGGEDLRNHASRQDSHLPYTLSRPGSNMNSLAKQVHFEGGE